MRKQIDISILLFLLSLSLLAAEARCNQYPWLNGYSDSNSIIDRFPTPSGYVRIDTDSGSFADWLRHLPLKPGYPPIMLHSGLRAAFQDQHCAVVDIDVGTEDLQQCADAIIRLRAEYLRSIGKSRDITFNFTSGDRADYYLWIDGYRPKVNGNDVSWQKSASVDTSYRCLRDYLDAVFTYAGTYSLSRDIQTVETSDDIEIGDCFIIPGFPGHAVMVADVAANSETGERVFLLIQGFTPAQEIHILRNDIDLSPWFTMPYNRPLKVMWYDFTREHLRRF